MINIIKNFFTSKYEASIDEFNRFGTISILLIVVAIFGGVAVGSFTHSPMVMAIITAGTMLTEAFILAVQPMKKIVNIGIVACLINLLFIIAGMSYV
jgi:hypothetical protein